MPVIEGPSIWDYLAKAGGDAIDTYQAAKEKVRQDAATNAGLLNQLFATGAIDSQTLAPAVNTIPGMQNVKIQPNVPEKQRTPGTPEYAEYQAKGEAAQQDLHIADVTKRWQNGEVISEKDAYIAKLPTDADMKALREARTNPGLELAAQQYIDQYILSKGGRLTPAEAMQISGVAFQNYVRNYQASGMGVMSPAEQANAQRFFASHAVNRMMEQRKLDVEAIAAQNKGAGYGPQDRQFAQLTTLQDVAQKELDSFRNANRGIDVQMSLFEGHENEPPPPAGKGPSAAFRKTMRAYQAKIDRVNQLQRAQSLLGMGILPDAFANLLAPTDGSAGAAPGRVVNPAAGTAIGADGSLINLDQIKSDYQSGKLSDDGVNKSSILTEPQKAEIIASKKGAKPAGKPTTKPTGKKTSSAPVPVDFSRGMTSAQRDSSMAQTGRALTQAATTAGSVFVSAADSRLRALQQKSYDDLLAQYGPNSFLTIAAGRRLAEYDAKAKGDTTRAKLIGGTK